MKKHIAHSFFSYNHQKNEYKAHVIKNNVNYWTNISVSSDMR